MIFFFNEKVNKLERGWVWGWFVNRLYYGMFIYFFKMSIIFYWRKFLIDIWFLLILVWKVFFKILFVNIIWVLVLNNWESVMRIVCYIWCFFLCEYELIDECGFFFVSLLSLVMSWWMICCRRFMLCLFLGFNVSSMLIVFICICV